MEAPTGRPTTPRPTIAEREALGREARERVPRASHADLAPAADRRDPLSILAEQDRTRVGELVPIRYGRMLDSPFSFYRGGAAIMASDLAATARSGLEVQCCGDAHLSNFGVFASPERRLVFDVNDFDETLRGPWEWDVKRLAASVAIAGRHNDHSEADQHEAVRRCVGEYRRAMREFAGMATMAVWNARLDVEEELSREEPHLPPASAATTERWLARARTRDSMSALADLTDDAGGRLAIRDHSPLVVPLDRLVGGEDRAVLFDGLAEVLARYTDTLDGFRRVLLDQFQLVDFARKVVGVGSVGTRSWIALLLDGDGRTALFLQIKEAGPSVLERHLAASPLANHGERVVTGQHLMQAATDILLGWVHVEADLDGSPRDYYVRQLRDWKRSVGLEGLHPGALATYGRLCGWTLARAHARSGDRVAIAAYLGGGDTFDGAIAEFARAYAEQNDLDFHRLVDAVDAGAVQATTGI